MDVHSAHVTCIVLEARACGCYVLLHELDKPTNDNHNHPYATQSPHSNAQLNGILRTWQLPVSLRFAETARAAVGECIATSHLFPCQVPRVAGAVADVPTEKSQGFALEG